MNFAKTDFSTELKFKTNRSSGKGGQHVNKTESRVSLFFDVLNSTLLREDEKSILQNKLQLSNEGILQINCETNRSQLKNKEICIRKFNKLLAEALIQPKKRKPTKPSKSSIRKRLRQKKKRSEIKKNRKAYF